MKGQARTPEWFELFLKQLATVVREEGWDSILDGAEDLLSSDELAIDENANWPARFGWFIDLGGVDGGDGELSIWFDRYLEEESDPKVGVWFSGPRDRSAPVLAALGAADAQRFTWGDRSKNGLLTSSVAAKGRRKIGEWMVDDWTSGEVYVGKYLRPTRRSVIQRVSSGRCWTSFGN